MLPSRHRRSVLVLQLLGTLGLDVRAQHDGGRRPVEPRPTSSAAQLAAEPSWETFPSVDAVTDCNGGKPAGYSNSTCFHVGISDDAQGCEKLVAQLLASGGPAINVFTWHDKSQGKFAKHCIGRTDNIWSPHGPGPGHVSGCNSAAVSCKKHPPIGPSGPSKVPLEFECGMREAAYHFGQHLAPARGTFVELFDAMQLETLCNKTRPVSTAASSRASWVAAMVPGHQSIHGRRDRSSKTLKEFHVGASGSDANPGSATSPFASIERAVGACRVAKKALSYPCKVLVHAPGTYYLNQTLQLGASDTGLTIQGLSTPDGELPVLSGGVPLSGMSWVAAGGKFPAGVMKAALPAEMKFQSTGRARHFDQLFVDGARHVRARHPNANPGGTFRTGRWTTPNTGYFPSAKAWVRSENQNASHVFDQFTNTQRIRNTSRYGDFILGYGGPVSQFDPPAAYWAVDRPPAGGGCKYEVPQGVVYEDAAFVAGGAMPPSAWESNTTGAIVHAFHHAYWGDWKFSVDKHDKEGATLHFGRGGFQEARGSCGSGGHDWMVENVKELLDTREEWWLDDEQGVLYHFPNTTDSTELGVNKQGGTSPVYVASMLDTLIAVNGTMDAPARNIHLSGLTLAHAAPTFMSDYEVPSAGDWSIHRGGAVYIEGAENVSVSSCFFDQAGGNGVAVSRYTRDVVIFNNEMHRIGDTGVVVVGDLKYDSETPWLHVDGNYPVGTVVANNFIHELGVFTKQTAGFFQALAARSTVRSNIIINGPRSAVNFNDAAFGGNVIELNLMANVVRETVDHGPYNSWDRNPFLFLVPGDGGQPTTTPTISQVKKNFIYCSYGGVKGIDHDDGASAIQAKIII